MDEVPGGLRPPTNPADAAGMFARLTPEQAGAVAAAMAQNNAASNHWAVGLLGVAPGDRVLEVGSGPGMGIELLAERAEGGVVVGIDLSPAMVDLARARIADLASRGRAQVHVAAAERLPFADGSFAKALAVHVAQFWPAPEPALAEVRRVLADGGTLVLATRAHRADPDAPMAARLGWTPAQVEAMADRMRAAGFRSVGTTVAQVGEEELVALIGTR